MFHKELQKKALLLIILYFINTYDLSTVTDSGTVLSQQSPLNNFLQNLLSTSIFIKICQKSPGKNDFDYCIIFFVFFDIFFGKVKRI